MNASSESIASSSKSYVIADGIKSLCSSIEILVTCVTSIIARLRFKYAHMSTLCMVTPMTPKILSSSTDDEGIEKMTLAM